MRDLTKCLEIRRLLDGLPLGVVMARHERLVVIWRISLSKCDWPSHHLASPICRFRPLVCFNGMRPACLLLSVVQFDPRLGQMCIHAGFHALLPFAMSHRYFINASTLGFSLGLKNEMISMDDGRQGSFLSNNVVETLGRSGLPWSDK